MERGSRVKVRSSSDIPKNREQIWNFERQSDDKTQNDITMLLLCTRKNPKLIIHFLREISEAPELQVYFCRREYGDTMWNDFCCNKNNAGILCMDIINKNYVGKKSTEKLWQKKLRTTFANFGGTKFRLNKSRRVFSMTIYPKKEFLNELRCILKRKFQRKKLQLEKFQRKKIGLQFVRKFSVRNFW